MGLTPHKEPLKFPTEEELRSCTEFLEKNPHSVQKWMHLADKYMQTFVENRFNFLLPKAHEFLGPVIYRYAHDTEGFTRYLLELRDTFSKQDLAWEQVQKLQRRVNGRFVQQQRRERSSRAVVKAIELHGEADYHQRLQWVAKLEHEWAGRRLLFLDAYRDTHKKTRIDTETRSELLAQFWDIVDTEIFEGKGLPPWN